MAKTKPQDDISLFLYAALLTLVPILAVYIVYLFYTNQTPGTPPRIMLWGIPTYISIFIAFYTQASGWVLRNKTSSTLKLFTYVLIGFTINSIILLFLQPLQGSDATSSGLGGIVVLVGGAISGVTYLVVVPLLLMVSKYMVETIFFPKK